MPQNNDQLTITIQISNPDDKFSQKQWNDFVFVVKDRVQAAGKVHFFGASPNYMPWQNVAWVISAYQEDTEVLRAELQSIRNDYQSEPIAMTEGYTQFL